MYLCHVALKPINQRLLREGFCQGFGCQRQRERQRERERERERDRKRRETEREREREKYRDGSEGNE